nr:MAG TPA: hypothetical protein [Microviridae sp.]
MRFKVIDNYDVSDYMHDYDPVSLAVPDQTMSLRELINCYQRGTIPLTAMRDGAYDSTDVAEDVNIDTYDIWIDPANRQAQDLTDIDDYGKELQELSDNFNRKREAALKHSQSNSQDKPSSETSSSPGEV